MLGAYEITRENEATCEKVVILNIEDPSSNEFVLGKICSQIWPESIEDGTYEDYGYFALPVDTYKISTSNSLNQDENGVWNWKCMLTTSTDTQDIEMIYAQGNALTKAMGEEYIQENYEKMIPHVWEYNRGK